MPTRPTRPVVAVVGLATMSLLLTACTSGPDVPARDPEATATVSLAGDVATLVDVDDAYYDGMALPADSRVVLADGSEARTDALDDGDRVRVRVGDACAESYPVQCAVEAAQVVG